MQNALTDKENGMSPCICPVWSPCICPECLCGDKDFNTGSNIDDLLCEVL